MGLTQLEICNQALLKLGADTIDTLTPPVSTEDGTKRSIELCNIFFDQAYDEILRIYQWNSATKRTSLPLLNLDSDYPDITVIGAGSTEVNGVYSYDSSTNSYISSDGLYKVYDNFLIFGDGLYWGIRSIDDVNTYYRAPLTTDTTPPKDTWEVFADGVGPAPTIDYIKGFGYQNYIQKPTDMIRLINCFRSDDQRDQRTAWVLEGDYILANENKLYIRYIAKPAETTDLEPLCTEALIVNLAKKLAPALQLDADWETKLNNELYQVILPKARSIDTFENKELLLEESDWMLSRTYQYPII